MFCENCGIQLDPNGKFCGKCGAKVEATQVLEYGSDNNCSLESALKTTHEPELNTQQESLYSLSHKSAQRPQHESIHGQLQTSERDQSGKAPSKKKWLILGGVILFLALLSATAILFFGQNQRNERMFQEAMNQGRHYLEAMDFTNAELAFLRAIEIDPRQVEPYLALADVYVEQEDFEQAFDILEQGLATVEEDARREELEQKQEEVREIYEQQLEDRTEHEPAENDQPEDATNEAYEEAEDRSIRDFVWVLEPSIAADDINYVMHLVDARMNMNKRHFPSTHAVIRVGNTFGLIDDYGNIVGGMDFRNISFFWGTYHLELIEQREHEEFNLYVHAYEWRDNEFIALIGGTIDGANSVIVYYHNGLGFVSTNPQNAFFRSEMIPDTPIPVIRTNSSFRDIADQGSDHVHLDLDAYEWYLENEGLYGIFYQGEMITDFIFTNTGSWLDGAIAVEQNGRWGYVNERGEVIIPIEFDSSVVWEEFIWQMGGIVQIESVFAASEGFIPLVRDGIWEMRDITGEVIIEPGIFEAIRPVYRGRSWVKYDGLWGIIQLVEADDEESPLSEYQSALLAYREFLTNPQTMDFDFWWEEEMISWDVDDIRYAELIDFDNDGIPELVLVIRPRPPIHENDDSTAGMILVFQYSEGIRLIYGDIMVGGMVLLRYTHFLATHEDGRIYLVPYSNAGTGRIVWWGYFMLANGEFDLAWERNIQLINPGHSFSIEGEEVSEEEFFEEPANRGIVEERIIWENFWNIELWDTPFDIQPLLSYLDSRVD